MDIFPLLYRQSAPYCGDWFHESGCNIRIFSEWDVRIRRLEMDFKK